MNRVTWTEREWQAIVDALPLRAEKPTPAQVDAAQRLALPINRHRPIVSLYGRHNRAHYMAELTLARLRNAQAPMWNRAKLASLRAQLAQVEAEIAAFRTQQAIDRARTMTPVAEVALCVETTTAHVTKAHRVDVVGCVGHQMERARLALPPNIADAVRFIDTNALRRMRDPADRVVLVTGFVSHAAQWTYRCSERVFVPKPTVENLVPAITQLARGDK